MKSLNVGKEELERAVKAAGTSAAKVREHLRGSKPRQSAEPGR